MESRIEILKDGVWTRLRLQDSNSIKYNAVINKIGEPTNRQIGSTNTFSLPKVSENIKALGINVFNQYDLAKALNRKYKAKYYVEEKIVQVGYLLINNTRGKKINVNFIDESLDVISKWGSITYRELLDNTSLPIEDDYSDSIDELSSYDLPTDSVLTPLSEVGTRGYNLCIFPSNLNAIGDLFQKDNNGNRTDDSFNPYQSRPIFNAMSLFDFACERYGYTGIFDSSVDWDTVKETYMISSENDKNEESESSNYSTVEYDQILSTDYYYRDVLVGALSWLNYIMRFPASKSIKPNDIENWKDSKGVYDPDIGLLGTDASGYKQPGYWRDSNTIFTPSLVTGNAGEISFRANSSYSGDYLDNFPYINVITYWRPTNPSADVINEWYSTRENGMPPEAMPFPDSIQQGAASDLDITINKELFNSVPAGAESLIGVSVVYLIGVPNGNVVPTLDNMVVTETSLNAGAITFDKYGQYEANEVDLRHGASRKSLKTLLSSVMHKEGILMNIYNDTKEIKFFSYGHYEAQQEAGEFDDWSKYHLKHDDPEWRTNYGNSYGKINAISLAEPFQGNTYLYELENQGEDSRYKNLGTDENKNFKDVSNVINVENPVNPWTEYTNKGLGLVEARNQSGLLAQHRISNDAYNTQGNFSGLQYIANVNYGSIPEGVREWYQLVDQAVRCKAKFLLPVDIIRNLDLSRPIYVNDLGGFYIIEKISEYENSSKPVTVELIKLISELESEQNPPAFPLKTSVVVSGTAPSETYTLKNIVRVLNSTEPSSATITAVKYDDDPFNGGSQTGDTIVQNVNFPPYTAIATSGPYNSNDPEIGWYRVTAVTDIGWVSNTTTVYLGPDSGTDTYIFQNDFGASEGSTNVEYEYYNYPSNPTYANFKYRLRDPITLNWLGPEQTISFPLSPDTGSVLVDFGAPGFYWVQLETNFGTTAEPLGGGWLIT